MGSDWNGQAAAPWHSQSGSGEGQRGCFASQLAVDKLQEAASRVSWGPQCRNWTAGREGAAALDRASLATGTMAL